MTKKRVTVQRGDVILIPTDAYFGIGVVLLRSKRMRNGMLLALLAGRYTEPPPIGQLSPDVLATPNYASTGLVAKGEWPIIGQRPDLADEIGVPLLRESYSLFRGDEYLGNVAAEDLRKYEQRLGLGNEAVRILLRRHWAVLEQGE